MEPTNKTTGTTDAAGNGHAGAQRRAQTQAHETVDRAARGVHDTVDRIAEKASKAASSLGDGSERFAEQKERMMAQTRAYVQTHPVASIGIAVAAGFLLSSLLRSGHHQ